MNKLKERIKGLEESTSRLRYEIKYLKRSIDQIEKEINKDWAADRSLLRQTEHVLLRKIACGITKHTFALKSVFFNKDDGHKHSGRFECADCFLKIERRLTSQEIVSARNLGMFK